MKRLIAGSLALILCAGAANAKTIWAVDNIRPSGQTSDSIFTFDSANPSGSVSVIGATGVDTLFGGLDFDRAGNLYAYAQTNNPGLYSINQGTGAATLIGSGGVDAGFSITDLSYNPATGQMLGLAIQSTTVSAKLYDINMATGAASFITNVAGTGRLEVCLSSDAAGRNYMLDLVANQMFEIVAGTAVALPSLLGYDANFSQGMAIDWSDTGMWGIGALDAGAIPLFNEGGQFRTVNGDGSTNLVGRIGANDKLYECGDIAFAPVPAPGALALLGLGGLVAGRRRR